MLGAAPRIGVFDKSPWYLSAQVREAGGEPVPVALPDARPRGGVALVREWAADLAQVSCSQEHLDALLIAAGEPEELAGLVLSALRLNLPTVVAPPRDACLFATLAALGLAPLAANPSEVVMEVAGSGRPRPLELIEDFSLANALRAAYSLGDGPETIVHLSAIAREAGVLGFDQILRVLLPDTPMLAEPGSDWFDEHGVAGLLAHLDEAIHDTQSVEGRLREALPPPPPAPAPAADSRLVFVQGRTSGTEALCRASGEEEVSGACRVFDSEPEAARAVEADNVAAGELLVVNGCGPRGGPGLLRLDLLAQRLRERGLEDSVAVVTDGLPSEAARGTSVSLVSPEAAAGGVIGRLRDGDTLRIDLSEGRIRTGVRADEIERRAAYESPDPAGSGYAARYARSALPALEGAGFG